MTAAGHHLSFRLLSFTTEYSCVSGMGYICLLSSITQDANRDAIKSYELASSILRLHLGISLQKVEIQVTSLSPKQKLQPTALRVFLDPQSRGS